jgi:meiotic recombination protein DMC1
MSKQQTEERESSQEETPNEDTNWNEIGKLQDLGINAGDIKKLKDAGCHTVESLTMRTKKSLCAIKGLSEAKVEKILEAVSKISVSTFVSNSKILEHGIHNRSGDACQEKRGD